MGDAGFFRGTSADQDGRFGNKTKKLLKQLKHKFPPELDTDVDLSKIKLEVIKPWISTRVTELLGIEDDVVISYIFNILEEDKKPSGKEMQINLTGFMESKTKIFMKELWTHFISAQSSPHGIPQEFLERKADEMRAKKEESDRIREGLAIHETARGLERQNLQQNFAAKMGGSQQHNANMIPIGTGRSVYPPSGPPPTHGSGIAAPTSFTAPVPSAQPAAGMGMQNPLLAALKAQNPGLAMSLAANAPTVTQPVIRPPRMDMAPSAGKSDLHGRERDVTDRGRNEGRSTRMRDADSRSRSRSTSPRRRGRRSSRRRSRSRSTSRGHGRDGERDRSRSRSRERGRSSRKHKSSRSHHKSGSSRRKRKSSHRHRDGSRSRSRSRSRSKSRSKSPVKEGSGDESADEGRERERRRKHRRHRAERKSRKHRRRSRSRSASPEDTEKASIPVASPAAPSPTKWDDDSVDDDDDRMNE
eukprot:CFRG2967T1